MSRAECPARVPAIAVALEQALGRVTAEPIWAARSSPPFDAANGWDRRPLRATVGASESTPLMLEADSFTLVDTGDPLGDGFDAVVMREDVHYVDGHAELRAAVAPYQHVRSIGEDISATELLLPAGHRLRPVDVAAAAASGATEVSCAAIRSQSPALPVMRCARWAASPRPASCLTPTR